MPTPNLTELVTVTLRNRAPEIADNVSNSNALLGMLNQKGNVKTAAGGRTIVKPLDYQENATFQYYKGYENLDVSQSNVIDAAEFDWKQAAVNVTWSGLEMRVQNSGREQQIDLLAARIRNAERTMKNNISTGVYSDGTGTNGKQIGGLQHVVANAPGTGTVGGINRATFTFWRNQTSTTQAQVFLSAVLLDSEMRDMWVECARGTDHTNLIVADQVAYNAFWDSIQSIQRITNAVDGVMGFQNLAYLDAPVIFDGDSGIRASTMYFLNTDFLFWQPHSATNMVPLEQRNSINQDASVVPLVFAGNLTCSNCDLQGVVFT